MIVQIQEATQHYYYRAVLAISPLTPDQIRAQIWPNGALAPQICTLYKFTYLLNSSTRKHWRYNSPSLDTCCLHLSNMHCS